MKLEIPSRYKETADKIVESSSTISAVLPELLRYEEEQGKIIIYCEMPFSIPHLALGLTKRKLREFVKAIKVADGTVKVEHGELVLCPYMRRTLTIKMTDGTIKLLKAIAKDHDMELREYCRKTLIKVAFRHIEKMGLIQNVE